MDMCVSIKANSQADNKWVYVMTTQNGQSHKILRLGSQIFTEKFSRGP